MGVSSVINVHTSRDTMSDEENDVFSGSVTSQPQMVNVQTSGPMYMVERSSAPQVIGILVIVYGVLMAFASLFSVFNIFVPISEDGATLPSWLVIGQMLTGLIVSGATAYAGYLIFSYKKKGIWISLGAIGAGWVFNSIWTYLSTDYALESSPDAAELGGLSELVAGGSAICGLFCAAICGLIVAIPLFMANSGME